MRLEKQHKKQKGEKAMNKGYVRVSSKVQSNGVSLEAQKESLKRYAGEEKIEIYQDIASGRNGNRKQLKKMLENLHPGDRVVCYRLDRISRSVRDLANILGVFEKKKVAFVSVMENFDTGSASGRAWLQILSVFAEFESNVNSERTRQAMAHCRERGQYLGVVPFGYSKKGGKLTPHLQEQETIKYAAGLREKGLSFDKISKRLNDELRPTKKGRLWYPDVINHIIRRDRELKEAMRVKV